ncbi:hypothetical protein K474DRAFT_1677617 [Panus rudis PR-1116 ss-1]|nr:hypothetical protein K474DRAFT_1677617 [Panus rudis PR-1116 ss-1]
MHSKFSKSLLGPLPVQPFFDTFVNPKSSGVLPILKRVLKRTFSRITQHSTSQHIEDTLMNAVAAHGFCPDYVLESRVCTKGNGSMKLRPNVCLYSREDSSQLSADWTNLEFVVDIHCDETVDPFPSSNTDSVHHSRSIDGTAGGKVLEDLEQYILAQFCRQHRTSTLALCIFGRYVRFLHVDHAGVTASEAVNYVNNPRIMADFFWRYNRLSRIERGFDPTVVPAAPAECRLLTQAVAYYVQTLERNDGVAQKLRCTLSKDCPTYKIEVVDESSSIKTEYIIRKPCAEPRNPLGRATRGYIALRLDNGDSDKPPASLVRRLVFLKDYWRVPSSKVQKESESYKELKEHGVPHIPEVLSAGDVFTGSQPQQTYTQQVLHMRGIRLSNPPKSLAPHIHHRIVQQLGLPLTSVRDARELVQVMRDALQALVEGYVEARILHRDVSKNNVLISTSESPTGVRRGLLNDWDISCKVPPDCTTILPRSGTWRFMSCELREETEKSHEIYDDLQSIFWVMLFVAARHFRHSGCFNALIFDEEKVYVSANGTLTVTGSMRRLAYLRRGQPIFECKALNDTFTQFRKLWVNYHYHDIAEHKKPHDESPLNEMSSSLLRTFDMALCRPAEDWANGDWVEDQYPKWDGRLPEPDITITTLNPCDQIPVSVNAPSSSCRPKESDHTLANVSRPSSNTLVPLRHQPHTSSHQTPKRTREDEAAVLEHPPARKRARVPQVQVSPVQPIVPPLRRSQRLRNKRNPLS